MAELPRRVRWMRWFRLLFKLLLLALVVGGLAYWMKLSPVQAVAHRLERGSVVAEVMGTGTVEARVKSLISPKISGRILSIPVDQGDRVTAGQMLFALDDAELSQQVEIADATVASGRAALTRLKADQAQAMAVLEKASRERDRTSRLRETNAVSEQESDKATEALRVAEAGRDRAEAALVEGQKQLDAAEKNRAYHTARLADTRITAPFDGLIVKRYRDPGDVVAPGSPTLSLISTGEIWVTAWVDETEMARLKVGQPARVVFRSEPLRRYEGQVARLGRETDRETREFVVDVRVLSLPENWAVGQRAEVYVETDRKNAVPIVPAKFIVRRDERTGVYCLDGGRAVWRAVKLGVHGRDAIQVTHGLSPGDIVLSAARPDGPPLDGRRVEMP